MIGGTGNIGQHLVTASLDAGHPTALLVRRATVASDSGKAKLLKALVARGATLVYVRTSSVFITELTSTQIRILLFPAEIIFTPRISSDVG